MTVLRTIPATAYHYLLALEAAAPMRRPIPIGSYDEIKDAAGKTKIKPKRKRMGTATEIAKRKRKKWRAAK